MLTADHHQFINRDLPPEERSCASKCRYMTREEARILARHGRGLDGRLEPYHCRYGGHWHLGRRRRVH